MTKYIVTRLLQAIPVFFIVGIITFTLMRIPEGDPVAFMAAENPEAIRSLNERISFLQRQLRTRSGIVWTGVAGDVDD